MPFIKKIRELSSSNRVEKEANKTKDRNRLIAVSVFCGIAILALAMEKNRIDLVDKKNVEELNFKLSSVTDRVEAWDRMNSLALSNLVKQPDIISMNPDRQKPVLENFVRTYQHLYLAHTVDLTGYNVARSDSNKGKDYSTRDWFAGVKLGININRQTVVGFSNNRAALCVGAPIREGKKILGAATICTDLLNLSKQIGETQFGSTGTVIVVDEMGKMLVHPNSAFLSAKEVKNFSEYPPVKNLLEGRIGEFYFTDQNNQKWISLGTRLDNEWGVLVLISEKELLPNSNYKLVIYLAIGLIILFFIFSLNHYLFKHIIKRQEFQEEFKTNENQNLQLPEKINNKNGDRTLTSLEVQKNNPKNQRYLRQTKWILIVDKNQENLRYCTKVLESLGFKVVSTSDQNSGYNIASNKFFDLILIEILSPISSGRIMVSRLRKLACYSKTPIIGICNNIQMVKKTENSFQELSDFLEKPLEKNKLISIVSKHLNLSSKDNSTQILKFPDRKKTKN